MARNQSFSAARKAAEDEFYTQISDIEKELRYYKHHFKNKIIFCNCDDPKESNFWKYFFLNFGSLGLKKLISTHYESSGISYKLELVQDEENIGKINEFDIIQTPLNGDGDFRSEECIQILKEVDIVVTNPPFSLFREYVAQLIEHNKSFLIIGNQNNVTYKETFNLLKDNKMWLGYYNGDMSFKVPDHYEPRKTRFWIDENGQKWRSFGNICWFTNLDIAKRHEKIILYRNYNQDDYPKYDDSLVINVGKVADIPADYTGIMGVPITFMNKYNPEQFEILGIANSARWIGYDCLTIINGKKIYNRIIIRRRDVR